MYKAYIFDLYGTLADIQTNEEKRYLWVKMSELYAGQGAVYAPWEMKRLFREWIMEETARVEALHEKEPGFLAEPDLRRVFARLYLEKGVAYEEKTVQMTAMFFRTLSRQRIGVYDGVKETLQELRARGKKLYLLSNAQSDFTRPELELLGLSGFFHGILISSEEACKKPSPVFFGRLMERFGLNARDCLMTGNDEVSDIGGAGAAGMDSLYIHTETSPVFRGKYAPTYRVMDGDWKKVAAILMGSKQGMKSDPARLHGGAFT